MCRDPGPTNREAHTVGKSISVKTTAGPGGTTRLTLPIGWGMEAAFLVLMLGAYTVEGPLPWALGAGAILLVGMGWALGGVQQSLILNPTGRPLRIETRWFGVPHGTMDVVGTPTHLFVEATCFYGRAGLTGSIAPHCSPLEVRFFLRPKSHDYEEVKRVTGKWPGIHLPVSKFPRKSSSGSTSCLNAPSVFGPVGRGSEIHYQEAYSRKLKEHCLWHSLWDWPQPEYPLPSPLPDNREL